SQGERAGERGVSWYDLILVRRGEAAASPGPAAGAENPAESGRCTDERADQTPARAFRAGRRDAPGLCAGFRAAGGVHLDWGRRRLPGHHGGVTDLRAP